MFKDMFYPFFPVLIFNCQSNSENELGYAIMNDVWAIRKLRILDLFYRGAKVNN